MDPAQEPVDVEEVDSPTQGRIRLATVGDVRIEMARVYREMRGKKLDPALGTKLVWVLLSIAKINEIATIEDRLRLVEDALNRRTLGHDPKARATNH